MPGVPMPMYTHIDKHKDVNTLHTEREEKKRGEMNMLPNTLRNKEATA